MSISCIIPLIYFLLWGGGRGVKDAMAVCPTFHFYTVDLSNMYVNVYTKMHKLTVLMIISLLFSKAKMVLFFSSLVWIQDFYGSG